MYYQLFFFGKTNMQKEVDVLYKNRCNSFVMKRHIEESEQIAKKQRLETINHLSIKKRKLEYDLQNIGHNIQDIAQLRVKKQAIEKVSNKQHQLEVYGSKNWMDRVNQLPSGSIASLVILQTITGHHNNKERFPIDPTKCSRCGKMFKFEIENYTNICPFCKLIQRVLIGAEDIPSDNLSIRSQKTIQQLESELCQPVSNVKKPEKRKYVKKTKQKSDENEKDNNEEDNNEEDDNDEKINDEKVNSVDRAVTYRKYLMQFYKDAPELPKSVLTLLYQEFNSIHYLNSLRCKPTSVQSILKAHGMSEYIIQATRCWRKFNRQPIPLMSIELIDALVIRFQDVSLAISTIENFGKLPSFEILTYLFLRGEKRDDLAKKFLIAKVAVILKSSKSKLCTIVDACRTNQLKMSSNWEEVPKFF